MWMPESLKVRSALAERLFLRISILTVLICFAGSALAQDPFAPSKKVQLLNNELLVLLAELRRNPENIVALQERAVEIAKQRVATLSAVLNENAVDAFRMVFTEADLSALGRSFLRHHPTWSP